MYITNQMSQDCFEDCFLSQDLCLDAFPCGNSYRKPSSDDLLYELLASPNCHSVTHIQSPKQKTKMNIQEPFQQKKMMKRKKENDKNLKEHLNKGHWKLDENKRYHWFLEIHSSHFLNRHMRRMDKIFKTMEKFVGTREAQQCRSHHQKMQKKHGTFSKILLQLRKQHYGEADTASLITDMISHGIDNSIPLLNRFNLQSGYQMEIRVQDDKQTPCKSQSEIEWPQIKEVFVDPMAQEQAKNYLDILIL